MELKNRIEAEQKRLGFTLRQYYAKAAKLAARDALTGKKAGPTKCQIDALIERIQALPEPDQSKAIVFWRLTLDQAESGARQT